MEKKRVTVTEVAALAGVSKGTVDRVLHNRGEVSAESAEKVRRAVAELGFKPNLYASMLAAKRASVIAVILPRFKPGQYWSRINDGYRKVAAQVLPLNLKVCFFNFELNDEASFRHACSKVLEISPAGVAFSPVFRNESLNFVEELYKRGIPYVYVDTKLEEGNYYAYYGMPMYQSGYLCGALLTERLKAEDVWEAAIVRIIRDKTRQSDPTVSRREGFIDFMERNYPACQIHSVFIDPSNREKIYSTLQAFFAEHPDLKLIAMFNSRIYLLSDYLAANAGGDVRVIGFDDLEDNMKMLRDGQVSVLISQHIDNQASYAVQALSDLILLNRRVDARDNYMHMDILTKYNLENY